MQQPSRCTNNICNICIGASFKELGVCLYFCILIMEGNIDMCVS